MLKAVDTAIQVHGALGVTDDTVLAYWYRHERAARIYDGADEVHKTSLGRRILRRYARQLTTGSRPACRVASSVPGVGLRDRFFTPTTAKAIMSWRILLGAGVAVVAAVAGAPLGLAVALGAVLYVGSVFAAMPRAAARPAIDPFTLSEPWRRLIQQAQSSGRKLRSTIEGLDEGPLRQQLRSIADQLDHGLDEAWQIARRGDEIDDVVRTLDPVRLRSKLATLQGESTDEHGTRSPDADAAIASVEQQLATADRLKQQSAATADSLRATQTQTRRARRPSRRGQRRRRRHDGVRARDRRCRGPAGGAAPGRAGDPHDMTVAA